MPPFLWARSISFLSHDLEECEELFRPIEISFLSFEIYFLKIILFFESIPLISFGVDFEVFVKFSSFLIWPLY